MANDALLLVVAFILLVFGGIATVALAWFSLTSPGPACTRAVLTVKSSDETTVWLGLFSKDLCACSFQQLTAIQGLVHWEPKEPSPALLFTSIRLTVRCADTHGKSS
jgi:hypothetical protein